MEGNAEAASALLLLEQIVQVVFQGDQCLCGEGLAHDTIRPRLFVIRATSLYMSRTYPRQYGHITGSLRLKRPRQTGLPRGYLTPEQVRMLLEAARRWRPDLLSVLALQVLAGLRVREAIHLREQDLDLRGATVTIAATPHHLPRTRHSHRTIPICPTLVGMLREAVENIKVRMPEGYLFSARHGGPWDSSGIHHAAKRLFRRLWQERGIEVFRELQPH